MSLLDAILMPRLIVETISMQAEKRVVNLLPILPEDEEYTRIYDPTVLITRKNGVQYRLGEQISAEERKARRRLTKQKWYARPEVKEKQRAKNRARQQKLVARRKAASLASASTDSPVSKRTRNTKLAQP